MGPWAIMRAEVEDVGALGEPGHELHVVLDEEDGEALLGLHLPQGAGEVRGLLAVEARTMARRAGGPRAAVMRARPTSTSRPLPRLRCSIGSVGDVAQPEQRQHLVTALDLVGAAAGRGR